MFGIDHLDGSGNYTLKENGEVVVMDTDMDRDKFEPGMLGQEIVFKINEKRKNENLSLIDEILDP